jgi:hypothetical protein
MSTQSTYKGTFTISCFNPEQGKWYTIKSAYDLFNLGIQVTGLNINNSKMDMFPQFPENLTYLKISNCPNLRKITTLPPRLEHLVLENNKSLECIPALPKTLLYLYIVKNRSLEVPTSYNYGIRDLNITYQKFKQPIDLPSSLLSLKLDMSYLRFMPRGYIFHYKILKREYISDEYFDQFKPIHFNDTDNIWRFTLVNNDAYEEYMEDVAVTKPSDFIPLKHMEMVYDIDYESTALYV